MSLYHFYLTHQVISNEKFEIFPLQLSDADAHHARVARLSPGEHIAIIDARQDYFECEIVEVDDILFSVRIARHFEPAPGQPRVGMALGLTKGDKFDQVIRQGTELGVTQFLPLLFTRCVVKLTEEKCKVRTHRWQEVAKSAAMQSGQRKIPSVVAPLCIEEAYPLLHAADCVLIFWEEAHPGALIEDALQKGLLRPGVHMPQSTVVLIIGPEGGITSHEVDTLMKMNEHTSIVSLGDSILRSETAGIVASALVIYELRRMMRTLSADHLARKVYQ